MKGTIYNYEKQDIENLSSITVSGSEIHFNDAYGNSKDVDLGRFTGLQFGDPEEVMVSLKGKNNVWLPASWFLTYYCSNDTVAVIYKNKDGEDESFCFKSSELREIVFEEEEA